MSGAHRCLYLAHCYAPAKRYAEALALVQHARIHLRETRSVLSTIDVDPIAAASAPFFPLSPSADLDALEGALDADGLRFRTAWFLHNGGALDADAAAHKKPLFFDVALNYVQLDMDRLQERAGKKPAVVVVAAPVAVRAQPPPEKKPVARAKLEEQRAPTPEPTAPAKGGLSSLLGGWWGRQ